MRTTALLALLLHLLPGAAQWPTDPNSPLVICNNASDQTDRRMVSDGAGGWYVLWRDNRLDPARYAVYGQRLNAQGDLLWDPNGRLLQEVPGRSINMIGVNRMSDGKLFLAYISAAGNTGGDTVRAMAYDTDGQPAWAQPTLLAHPGLLPGGGTSTGNYFPRVTPVLNGVFVGWGSNPIGAADYIHLARILNDGTNMMPVQGVEVASLNNSIVAGPWTMRHDLAGGLLLEERWGNGFGAPLYAMRVDSVGDQLWPANLVVSANSSGLGYEWSTAVAATGRVNSVWANGSDLRMALYDTSGVLLNPNASIPVCLQAEVQENPFVVQTDDGSVVLWADNRTGAGTGRQVFMQRFDSTGGALLAIDGVPAMQVDGNLNGFPRAILAENNSFIVAMVSTTNLAGGTAGFRAQRTTFDGIPLWSDTTRFCTPALAPNGGSDFSLVSDGDGGIVATWFDWTTNAIYAARLDRWGRMGDFTGVDERTRSRTVLAHPVPAEDRITFQLPDETPLLAMELVDARGTRIPIQDPARQLELNGLPAGPYVARILTGEGIVLARFIKL